MKYTLSALLVLALFCGCKKEEDDAAPVDNTPTQSMLQLVVDFKHDGGGYNLYNYIQDANGRDVEFNKVRILLSNLRLLDANGNVTHSFGDKVILLDRTNGQMLFIDLGMVNSTLRKRLAFDIGLDATTNAMDSSQFSGPPLTDQTLWISASSGHKFVTLEGRVDANNDGIVGSTEQAVTYQCITSAMLRTDELDANTTVGVGSQIQIHMVIQMAGILNGVNCMATPTAIGANSVNAQLMSNLQSAIYLY